ncbi:hypothetical protein [Marivita sp.]|uniref:hypothetical protein n=1 Tax=Marivita sp. TaxID=2003365 RepID=UPI003F7296A6
MHRWLFPGTGLFLILVGAVLLLDPQSYLGLYATSYDPGMDFPARRFSPAVLALGVVLILARTLERGPFLTSLCLISGLAFLGVAATGVHAWTSGTARPAILAAATIEVVIASLYLLVARRMWSQ